jgi:hypothetical protein
MPRHALTDLRVQVIESSGSAELVLNVAYKPKLYVAQKVTQRERLKLCVSLTRFHTMQINAIHSLLFQKLPTF